MKTRLVLVLFALSATRAFALFGVGDIVFDPANFAQAVQLVSGNMQQISQLASIAGINTQQLNTMNGVLRSVGQASDIANYPRGVPPQRLVGLINQTPGMESFGVNDLGKLFNGAGVLDVFMGTPVSDWEKMVRDPMRYFGDTLKTQAVRRIGSDLGMDNAEINFANWVTRMNPGQRAGSRYEIVRSASDLLLNQWYQSVESRRMAQQQLAAKVKAQDDSVAHAQTTNELLAAQSAQTTTSNEIMLHSVTQSATAHEAQAAAQQAETSMLQEQIDREKIGRSVDRLVP